jgi:hypothetical protein
MRRNVADHFTNVHFMTQSPDAVVAPLTNDKS